MTHYIGILDGTKDVWGVRIPDLPGCHGAGGSADAAIADAISAAKEWAAHRATGDAPLPAARGLDQILRDDHAGLQSNEVAVMIPVFMDSGRPVRARA